MAGGPEDHFTDGRWNWWLPDWAASSSASTRRLCRRRRPRSEAGIRVHLRSAEKGTPFPFSSSDQLPKSCHVKDEVAPHPTRRTVYKVANKRIPRISRRRSSEAPADPRRSPQITATEALLTPVIPAYPRPARNYQDRPVTPEVAGSSPVAPVSQSACKRTVSASEYHQSECGPWPKPGPNGRRRLANRCGSRRVGRLLSGALARSSRGASSR